MGCNDIEIRKSESVAKSQFLLPFKDVPKGLVLFVLKLGVLVNLVFFCVFRKN